jgi:hypothetical protein
VSENAQYFLRRLIRKYTKKKGKRLGGRCNPTVILVSYNESVTRYEPEPLATMKKARDSSYVRQ